jgi:hypothetical protein
MVTCQILLISGQMRPGVRVSRPGTFAGGLADAEDDDFGRFYGSDTFEADEPAVVEIVLRHCGAIALHEEGIALF